MAIVREAPKTRLRLVQKEYEGDFVLQMGMFERDTQDPSNNRIAWEDILKNPFLPIWRGLRDG